MGMVVNYYQIGRTTFLVPAGFSPPDLSIRTKLPAKPRRRKELHQYTLDTIPPFFPNNISQ